MVALADGFFGQFLYFVNVYIRSKNRLCQYLIMDFLGQMIFATLLSALGLLGLEIQKPNLLKMVGLLLVMMGGLVMIYAENQS